MSMKWPSSDATGDADRRLIEDRAQLLVTFEQRVGATEELRIQRRHYLEAPGSHIAADAPADY